MPKFIPYDYNQSAMVVINYQDQLQPGTYEHALHHLLDKKLDLSVFYPKFQNDETGRPAYHPALLLKIILFAYSKGITSSREIQWCCETNIIFKALSCDTVPHFTTIAEFVSSRSEEIEALFEQILLICDQQGLLGHELFAIDGCKMSSNASKEWSGTFKELEQKREKIKRQIRHHLKEHKQQDKQESRDDERIKRTQQTIDTLDKAFEKVDQFLKSHSPRKGHGKRPKEVKSNITDNQSAKMTTSKGTIQGYNGLATVDKKHQIIIDAQAFGEGQEHHTLQPIIESVKARYQRLKINRDIYKTGIIVTADTGFANEANMQYLHENKINGYIPDNQFRSRDPKFTDQKSKYGKRHQRHKKKKTTDVISASEFDYNPTNKTCVCPAGQSISYRTEGQDRQGNKKVFFEGRLLQCRNCTLKHQCMKNPKSANHRKGNGRQVSFILEKRSGKTNYTDWMKRRVDSTKGKQVYSHRMSVVEPVFGNIGTNKRLNRFSLRGKRKVQGQWQLYCMVHNIEKLVNYGNMAA
ncbi:MAG: IS1182 family transposase [Candidatus Thiodiazotropha sp. (ex Semelilucina semeliformis)]|nr:IS1182 family transposase [Candidatus Thiodiazotropha sp. (ex Semelilucina semeliformis)]